MPNVEPALIPLVDNNYLPANAWPHIREYPAADHRFRVSTRADWQYRASLSPRRTEDREPSRGEYDATQIEDVRVASRVLRGQTRPVLLGNYASTARVSATMESFFNRVFPCQWIQNLSNYLFMRVDGNELLPTLEVNLSPTSTNILGGFVQGLNRERPQTIPYRIANGNGPSAFRDNRLSLMYPAMQRRMANHVGEQPDLDTANTPAQIQERRQLLSTFSGSVRYLPQATEARAAGLAPALVHNNQRQGGLVILHTEDYVAPNIRSSSFQPEYLLNHAERMTIFDPRLHLSLPYHWNTLRPAIAWVNPDRLPPANVPMS